MIEVKITDKIINRGKTLYNFYKINNSITKGMSQDYGALGEAVFMEYYGLPDTSYAPTKDYDIIHPNGHTIDVKTKKCNSKPKPHYFASVTLGSYGHQKCDYYCFIRINTEMTLAWICGFITKANMSKFGKLYRKGELDPSSGNNFNFKDDCWNIEIEKLNVSKSTKFTPFYIESLGYTLESNGDYISTNLIPVTRNGYDDEVKLSYNIQTNGITVQSPYKVLFEGFCTTQNEFNQVLDLTRIKYPNDKN